MHHYKLIPAQPELLRVAIPVFLKISDSFHSKDSLIRVCEDKDLLLYRETKNWGIHINEKNETLFIGPRIKYFSEQFDFVYGVDKIDFVSIDSEFEFDIQGDDLQMIPGPGKQIERNVLSNKIAGRGFFDYGPAIFGTEEVKGGNWAFNHFGLRSGSQVDFYGKFFWANDLSGENEINEVGLMTIIPNNRDWNPSIVKTFFGTENNPVDLQIMEYLSVIQILDRDYSNFYLHKQSLNETGLYLCGFMDLAAVLALYYSPSGSFIEKPAGHDMNDVRRFAETGETK